MLEDDGAQHQTDDDDVHDCSAISHCAQNALCILFELWVACQRWKRTIAARGTCVAQQRVPESWQQLAIFAMP